MRIEHLERDVAVVTDPPQVVDDRPELKVALARQDPIAIACQLARGAAHVAYLNPGQIAAGTGRRGLRACSGRCSNGTHRGRRRRWPIPTARSGQAPSRGRRRGATTFETRARSARRTIAASSAASARPAAARAYSSRPGCRTKSGVTISVGTPSSCKSASRRRK